jgi:hypothetical protein
MRSGYETKSMVVLEKLSWQTFEHRWKKNKAVLMFKVVYKAAPSYLTSQFSKRDGMHDKNVTSSLKLEIPKPNTIFLNK